MRIMIKIFQILSYLLSALACYKILSPIYPNIVPRNESLFMPFLSCSHSIPSDSILQIFTSNDHFYVILSVLHVFTQRYLPELLKIHPVECYEKYTVWLLFISVYFLLIVFVKNLFKYISNNKFVDIFAPFLSVLFIFVILKFTHRIGFTWVLQHDCWTYAYILLPAIAFILFYEFEKYYVLEKSLNKRQIFVFCSLLIINAFSNEYFRFIICCGLFLGFILHLLILKTNISKNKFLLTWIGISILNCLVFFTSNFQDWFAERNNHYTLSDLINIFPNFISTYFNKVIMENKWFFIFIALFLIAVGLFVKNKDRNKRIFIYTISVIISALLFQILIIVGLEEGYNIQYSFQHQGIKMLTKMILFSLNLSLLGYLFAYCKNIAITIGLTVISLLPFYYGYDPEIYNFKYNKEEVLNYKRELYILDRCFISISKKTDIFYTYQKSWVVCPDFSFSYFSNLYGNEQGNEYRQKVYVCNDNDNTEVCENKMKDFIKQKTGYVFSEEELKKLDFSIYDKYRNY